MHYFQNILIRIISKTPSFGSPFLLAILLGLLPQCLSSQKLSPVEQRAEKAYKNQDIEKSILLYSEALIDYKNSNLNKEAWRTSMQLGKIYMHKFNIDSAYHFFSDARNIAKNNNLNYEYGMALNSLTAIFNYKLEHDSIINTANLILGTADLNNNQYSDAYSALSSTYEARLKYDKSEEFIRKAIELDSITQDSSSMPFNLTALARLESLQLKYDKSLNHLFQSINYLREDKDQFKLASIYYEIAKVFFAMNNTFKAQEYALKSFSICEEQNLKITKINPLLLLAKIEEIYENYEKALKYYFEAEEISISKKRKQSTIQSYLGIALCHLELGHIEVAESKLKDAEAIIDNTNNLSYKLKAGYIRAKYMLKNGQADKAYKLAIGLFEQAKESEHIYLMKNLSGIMSQANAEQGNFRNAYNYLMDYSLYKDSIYTFQQSLMTQELEAKYKRKEQDTTIDLLATENELKSTRLKQQNIVMWGSIIGLLFLLGFTIVVYSFNKKLKSQKALVEKSLNEKNVLLREIHHRVKNNLQVISSLLALQSKYIVDTNAINALQQGQDRVQTMALIHEDLYKSENLTGVHTEIYFEQLIDNLFESYNIHEERVQLKMDVDPIFLDVDTMIPLGLILNELVSNALKHAFKNEKEGTIYVSLKEKDSQLILTVKDDGSELKSADQIQGKSFGYELVHAFARKLQAEINTYIDNGLGITLTIKKFTKAA